jgi:hypothetical protein
MFIDITISITASRAFGFVDYESACGKNRMKTALSELLSGLLYLFQAVLLPRA